MLLLRAKILLRGMMRAWLLSLLCLASVAVAAEAVAPSPTLAEPAAQSAAPAEGARVFVIPVREQIGSAVLYVVRRGIKEAIDLKADAIVLDMKTPGGALDKTFSIMEAIARFPGKTITFVNTEAISAGAFISGMTDEIWFAPDGIIGAAAPVSVGGQEIDATMRLKIVSYLKARVRAMSEGKGSYRGAVISAMIDSAQELKIGETVIKEKGELLSLTASEAAKTYGDPPQALLSAGTAANLDDLIAKRFGASGIVVSHMELTWSEELAVWLNALSPVLLGLGMLALFIEFKTPGFGIFGIVGIACLATVFLGNYVAGLSGHEPMLVFGLGLLLVAIEVFFMPGVAVLAIAGLVLMFGSVVWSMADLWPKDAVPAVGDANVFVRPLLNVALGVAIAVALGVGLARYLPHGWIWDRLVLGTAIAADASGSGSAVRESDPLIGARGVAVSALRPGGRVEIDGKHYEASVALGDVAAGTPIVVRGRSDFGLIVEKDHA
ncbi:MAG TPA: NfeD family protein [Opitutus sp.]|nr:NfeD family protein [Opitutus sp.]